MLGKQYTVSLKSESTPHCVIHIDFDLIMEQCQRNEMWTQCKEPILDFFIGHIYYFPKMYQQTNINVFLISPKVSPPSFTLIVKKK